MFSKSDPSRFALSIYERQEQHHRRITFQDEFGRFLKKYRIEDDERYVWD